MIDLVCLVADRSMEATIQEVLRRPRALGIREIRFETIVHPNRDPGCFHQARELLAGYRDRAGHGLVLLDRAWDGAPADTGEALEEHLEAALRLAGLASWARAVVIDPELEVWIFSDSPAVAEALGWPAGMDALREALAAQGLWPAGRSKPSDPKATVDWLLRRAGRPRSSSLFRELAGTVSLDRCADRAFTRLRALLADWFRADGGEV